MKSSKLDYLAASGTVILCTLFTLVFNIYVRSYVPPKDYGIYTSVNMLLLYLNYIQLGVMNSYNRDYPQLLGAGDEKEAGFRKSLVFTYLLLIYTAAFVALSLPFLFLTLTHRMDLKLGLGFLTNSLFALFTALYNFLDNSLKAEKRFLYSSSMGLIKTAALILTGVFTVSAWGYYGLLISTLISLAVTLLVNFRYFTKLHLIFRLKVILEMIRYGLPLLVNGLVWTIMMSVDKFVILLYMTMEDLGIYSVALLGFSTLMLVPQSISQIFYIKMSRLYGATHDIEQLMLHAKKFTLYLAVTASFLTIGAYYILPIFIRYTMQDYSDGTVSAQILIIGVGLYSTTLLYSNLFSVLKLNMRLVSSTAVLCLLNFILSCGLVILWGRDIRNVAYGTSVSYALYAVILNVLLGKTLKQRFIGLIFHSLAPVGISVLLIILLTFFLENIILAFFVNMLLAAAVIYVVYYKTIQKYRRLHGGYDEPQNE